MLRTFRYLRLSLTSECSMRCRYCRPPGFRPGREDSLLDAAELETVVRHLANRHGLTKVRLTGGDPTARRDLTEIIRRLAGIEAIRDLAMTTNGLTLAQRASEYRRAGLHRVNVSLDSLNPEVFAEITGLHALDRVKAGIAAAREAGLLPLRLNTVVLAGRNDGELPELVSFAASVEAEIRFIELMPMGPTAASWAAHYVPAQAMKDRIAPIVARWEPLDRDRESARNYRLSLKDGRSVTVGFITPMSVPFCDSCDRLRLTADGRLFPCLMDGPRGSFLAAVRPRFDPDEFDRLLHEAWIAKPLIHPTVGSGVMTAVGG
ncbi:MAG: GTP 3',8-cyclase MoaA [Thermogutta sp.]